ncbi:MAG: ATP-binding protein [Nitrospirae bacterium]|nr:ATP-binding protein [Nitrospirota bacterium]
MLIEFSVTNYRSINQKQTLSMVAAKGGTAEDKNTFPTNISGLPYLLRSAVIYGANASGKTNVIRALAFMRSFVINSFSQLSEGSSINVKPFLFDAVSAKNPSEFEIIFVIDGTRYQYGFSVNGAMITEEWLISYPPGKHHLWFTRMFDHESSGYKWQFGRNFTGQKKVIKTATRQNSLFLSTAIALNDDQLKPVYNWFLNKLLALSDLKRLVYGNTINCYESNPGRIMSFLKTADTGISDIKLEKEPIYPNVQKIEGLLLSLPANEINEIAKTFKIVTGIKTIHNSGNGQITLDFVDDESLGTQKMFNLSGLWLDVLDNGGVLVVDELDSSLHSLLVRHLVGIFHNTETNPKNAQLIINTHDTTLLNPDIYRRDQVWFTEKDNFGATKLYSLVEFKPDKNENIEKGYLRGRYGAIPFIGDFEF